MIRYSYVEVLPMVLAVVFLGCQAAILLFHIAAIIYARHRLHPRRMPPLTEEQSAALPGVSILKPLTGLEPNIMTNLESFFLMDYPRFELLFCLESPTDPIYMTILTLMNRYPQVDAKIFMHCKRVNVNPKINNMLQGYQAAQYELVLVSDSGLRMKEDTLRDMVDVMLSSERVGMVHQVPFVVQREGFANVLHTVFFGTWHAKMYVGSALMGFNCTTGMSCLMKKAVLDTAPGGLAHFGRYLAEDYFLAGYFYQLGYQVVISRQPAWQDGSTNSVQAFRSRLTRWCKLRTAMLPHTMFLEPLTECFPVGIVASWGIAHATAGAANPWVYFLCHCLVWFLLDYLLLRQMLPNSEMKCSKFEFVCAWFFRELMSLPSQLQARCSREVEWRNKRYRIRWGGVTIELPAKPGGGPVGLVDCSGLPPPATMPCATCVTTSEPVCPTISQPVTIPSAVLTHTSHKHPLLKHSASSNGLHHHNHLNGVTIS